MKKQLLILAVMVLLVAGIVSALDWDNNPPQKITLNKVDGTTEVWQWDGTWYVKNDAQGNYESGKNLDSMKNYIENKVSTDTTLSNWNIDDRDFTSNTWPLPIGVQTPLTGTQFTIQDTSGDIEWQWNGVQWTNGINLLSDEDFKKYMSVDNPDIDKYTNDRENYFPPQDNTQQPEEPADPDTTPDIDESSINAGYIFSEGEDNYEYLGNRNWKVVYSDGRPDEYLSTDQLPDRAQQILKRYFPTEQSTPTQSSDANIPSPMADRSYEYYIAGGEYWREKDGKWQKFGKNDWEDTDEKPKNPNPFKKSKDKTGKGKKEEEKEKDITWKGTELYLPYSTEDYTIKGLGKGTVSYYLDNLYFCENGKNCDDGTNWEKISKKDMSKEAWEVYRNDIFRDVADTMLNRRVEQMKSFANVINPSIGAFEIGKILERWMGGDVSLRPKEGTWWYDAIGYFEAGFETAWCKERHAPSTYFTEDRPGHFVGGGDFPTVNSITIYALGKRQEYINSEQLDWNTNYRQDGAKPNWFPKIESTVPTTTLTVTTTSSAPTTTLIYSKTNPGMSAAGYIYKLTWFLKHPYTAEEVSNMNRNKRDREGLDKDGNITFQIWIKEEGTPRMTSRGSMISPEIILVPGGLIQETKVKFQMPYLTEICIKFDKYKWNGHNTEYPANCESPDDMMGKIILQEVEGAGQYQGMTPGSLRQPSPGSQGSDWDW